MKNIILASALIWLVFSCAVYAEQSAEYDYFSANRQMIRNGVQAVLTCNGLYTSHRTLNQVFDQELAYVEPLVGNARRGNYRIDEKNKMVSVGGGRDGIEVSAVFRSGIGCVVMAPGQDVKDIDTLPTITIPSVATISEHLPWPMGDFIKERELGSAISDAVDPVALQAASDWAFDRATVDQDTLSLLVVHKGKIVHERYAPGIDMHTRTRTWSTAKSIAATLIGIKVDRGEMELDSPLGFEWLPKVAEGGSDPRNKITLRHVLNMSSGLRPVDSFGMEYATGSGLAYWAGASSVEGARSRGLIREPGTFWDYENYDTLLAVYAMKLASLDDLAYHLFPYEELLNPLGMRNTLLSADRFGDFILSSQVYTNARDLARFGMLYLQEGVWQGKRLISKKWIDFVRTPAPATAKSGNFYGGQWWLVPDDRSDIPKDAYATSGNRGQYVIVVPSHDLVIVRRGLDYAAGRKAFNRWDLTREVLKAVAPK